MWFWISMGLGLILVILGVLLIMALTALDLIVSPWFRR
jgi:hypothetical protein